jgi:chromosome segregation ATPase
LEQKFADVGDVDDLTNKRQALKEQMGENKKKISAFNVSTDHSKNTFVDATFMKSDLTPMNESLKGLNKQIAMYDKQIQEESQRLEADSQAKHEEAQRNLERARIAKDDAQSAIPAIAADLREAKAKTDDIETQGKALEPEIAKLRSDITRCDHTLHEIDRSANNHLVAFGNDIPRVLAMIEKHRWVGDKPIGPLGLHVKVKEPEKWAEVLRRTLFPVLTAFAVTDARDRDALKKILHGTKKYVTNTILNVVLTPRFVSQNVLIIIYEKDLFDYSRGEPDEKYLTALRALNVRFSYRYRLCQH